ncbi:MAG: hypothetical protein PWQ10_324 [Patescibacteria group bacterium]|nr:hypothetical protein [Patescibacteria group bacterium]
MAKGIIISGYPGIGKTTASKQHSNIIDLECSDYKWVYKDENTKNIKKEQRKGTKNRQLNPQWPGNYIEDIINYSLKYDFILISQQKELRSLLDDKNISYIICFPNLESKEYYINRYEKRGNNTSYITIQKQNYEKWVMELLNSPQQKIILTDNQYLEEYLIKNKMLQESKQEQ